MSTVLLRSKGSSPHLPHCAFSPHKFLNLADLRVVMDLFCEPVLEQVIKWSGRHDSKLHEMFPHPAAAHPGVIPWFSLFLFFLLLLLGKYHCPVLYSVFSNNSHIVANKVSGNVFSYEVGEVSHYCHSRPTFLFIGPCCFCSEWIQTFFIWALQNQPVLLYHQAVEQLNFKTKSLRDLLTDEPFARKDIITIQVSFGALLCTCKCLEHLMLYWWICTFVFRIQQNWINSMFPTFFMSKITWKCWTQVSCFCN